MSVKSILLKTVSYPPILDAVRWVIEAGHRGEKRVIREEFAGTSGPILDVPSGTGGFSVFFSNEDYRGIDIDPKFVERSQERFPNKVFKIMDATKLEFSDESFNRVLVIGFLHHLDPPQVEESLRELKRVMRPGGTFVLIEDCPTRNWWNVLGKILQQLDEGGRIRPTAYYEEILPCYFTIKKNYPMRAGLWDYSVFVLEKVS